MFTTPFLAHNRNIHRSLTMLLSFHLPLFMPVSCAGFETEQKNKSLVHKILWLSGAAVWWRDDPHTKNNEQKRRRRTAPQQLVCAAAAALWIEKGNYGRVATHTVKQRPAAPPLLLLAGFVAIRRRLLRSRSHRKSHNLNWMDRNTKITFVYMRRCFSFISVVEASTPSTKWLARVDGWMDGWRGKIDVCM